MNPGPVPITDTLAADSAALAAAASAAEEALRIEREALAVLRDGWSSDSGSAAADFIESHCQEGEAVVAALRHAAAVLGSVGDTLSTGPPGDPVALARDQARARLGEPTPSAFPASDSAPAPAPAPALNWPAIPIPALPDLGGAIAGLVAKAVDAFGPDPAVSTDAAPIDAATGDESRTRRDTLAEVKQSPAAPPPAVQPASVPAPVTPATVAPTAVAPAPVAPAPAGAAALLAAEVPPPEPVERTPCAIAADELPQVGQ